MLTKLIKIGNSKGIRLPSSILKQCRIEEEIELEIKENEIILRPAKKPREGWEKAFAKMHSRGEDKLLIEENIDAEMEDWVWE